MGRSLATSRKATLTSLLYIFLLLGPAVSVKSPSTLIVEKDVDNLTVFEEDLLPGPRCVMWEGEVSTRAG